MSSKQERTNRGTNILLKTPAMGARNAGLSSLSDGELARTDLLVVSYHQTPDDWIRSWRDQGGERPAELGYIYVGDAMRSAAGTQTSTTTAQRPNAVTGVPDPCDLTELGIRISEYLEAWDGNGHSTRVYVDSLTSLLQYTEDVETAFKFLHVLVGRVRTVDADAYYTITPDAHSDRTMAKFLSLFDTAIESGDAAAEERG